jgi:RNA polymerase sigma factor (sigma-70 family)
VSDDAELLAAWRAGDARAGETLFERHVPALVRFFRNKVDRGIEDLIQTTFVACLESERRFTGRGGFRSFLLGIARHKLYGHYREVLGSREDLALGQQSFADLAPGITTDLAQRAEGQLLLAALRALPMEQQLVLEMFYWESMTAGEIAEACELPEGTVRTRLRTARHNLALAIAEAGNPGGVLAPSEGDLDDWAQSVLRAWQG